MPNWTNYHNKEAFGKLSDSLRKDYQWTSTDLLLLELLTRFTKTVNVKTKAFFSAIPEKYLKNIPLNERMVQVQDFFEKLAETGMCTIKHRSDDTNRIESVVLTQAITKAERQKKEVTDPAKKYLRHFYTRRDFKTILQRTSLHLPNAISVAEHCPELSQALILYHADRIPSLIFSTKETPNPSPQFTQELFANNEKPFLVLEFPALTAFDSKKRHQNPEKAEEESEQPFNILLPADINLKDLIKDFFVPLILAYLQEEKNKDVYKTIHHEWSKKIHSSLADSQLDPDARIERTLLAADLNDGAYFASVHVLTHVLRHLKLRNLPAAPSPIIYESTRFIYDYAMACRQLLNLEKMRQAEQLKDQEIIIDYLLRGVYTMPEGSRLPGPVPVSKKHIEDLADCSKLTTLGLKYRSVRDLMPLDATSFDQVPRVLEIEGKFLHRWHLVNYFILMQHIESVQVQHRLAKLWSETSIPRIGGFAVPDDLISADFIKTIELVHDYRSGAKIELNENQIGRQFEVFTHNFFPSPEMARSHKVESLVRTEENEAGGGKGPKLIVRNDIDKTIYRDIRNFSLAAYRDMLHLEYSSIRSEAADLVRARLGTFGYLIFMLKGLLGMGADPNTVQKAAGRNGTGSGAAARAAGQRAGPSPQAKKTIQELEEVLAKIPLLLRLDVKTVKSLVEPVVKSLNPDIRNLGDEEAKAFVKSFIAKTPVLNALPYRSDQIFQRYVLLVMRRNNHLR